MQFYFFVLLICFVIFLYSIFSLSKDDLLFVRKDITMEKIFNLAFLAAFVALFFARLSYVLLNPKPIFFSILGFFLFPYFPGLSLLGAVLGGAIFLFLYTSKKNMPIGRIIDFFTFGLMTVIPIGIWGKIILSGQNSILAVGSIFYYLFILVLFIRFVLPNSMRGRFKDGTLGIIFLAAFSIGSIFLNVFSSKSLSILTTENFVLVFILLSSSALFIKKELLKNGRN
ncbi:prolipoprotein diacylglyceryl transferase [Patescibacteria group bacterium]|nr:prolipoprotein diacylglyceryl transferase [Patescibacteria group bacterium]